MTLRQWQCSCGQWVDMTQLKHIHRLDTRAPTLAEMRAARLSGRESEALSPVTEISEVPWAADFPRRDKPDE